MVHYLSVSSSDVETKEKVLYRLPKKSVYLETTLTFFKERAILKEYLVNFEFSPFYDATCLWKLNSKFD